MTVTIRAIKSCLIQFSAIEFCVAQSGTIKVRPGKVSFSKITCFHVCIHESGANQASVTKISSDISYGKICSVKATTLKIIDDRIKLYTNKVPKPFRVGNQDFISIFHIQYII